MSRRSGAGRSRGEALVAAAEQLVRDGSRPEASEALYRALERLLGPYLHTWRADNGADVLHDVYLIMLGAIGAGRIRDFGHIGSYAYVVARRVAYRQLSASAEGTRDDEEQGIHHPGDCKDIGPIDPHDNPEQAAIRRQRLRMAARATATLSAAELIAVATDTETAMRELGRSKHAIEILRSRGRRRAREAFEQRTQQSKRLTK